MPITTPNMGLTESVIGTDSGKQWEENFNSSQVLIDSHDHSPGKGVPIDSDSIFLSADLVLNDNDLTLVRSVIFQIQPAALSEPADIGSLYVTGVDLWYNDANGNKIQVTKGSGVNATSFGISSPPASAFFISNVLVINANTSTPANVQGGSLLLGNNVLNSKYLTLSPPPAMAADYTLTLPALPTSQKIMTLDNTGTILAPYTVDNSTISIIGNVIQVATGGITGTQIAPNTITIDKRVPMIAAAPAALENILITGCSAPLQHTSAGGILIGQGTLVTAGRPIKVILQPNGAGPSYVDSGAVVIASDCTILITVDSLNYRFYKYFAVNGVVDSIFRVAIGAYQCVAPVTAGTHTISVNMISSQLQTSGATVGVFNCELVAFEL